jgi:GntR family transcriptional regulator, transcriptional repressor for pyruvate dehydrogenase complex
MLKPIKYRNITDQVYEQLRDMIFRGELNPGQRLMSEREMATFFKVGRPTVKSAIQRLIDQGLVESRRGVGTYVLDHDRAMEKRPLLQVLTNEAFNIVDFQEVRMSLECKSAELAAKRATEEDIYLIHRSKERIDNEMDSGRPLMTSDIRFHMNIAYASKNIVQIHLMKSLYDVQIYAMALAYDTVFSRLEIDHLIQEQHDQIFNAIRAHDPDSARSHMEAHIGTVMAVCRQHGL